MGQVFSQEGFAPQDLPASLNQTLFLPSSQISPSPFISNARYKKSNEQAISMNNRPKGPIKRWTKIYATSGDEDPKPKREDQLDSPKPLEFDVKIDTNDYGGLKV